MSEVYKIAVISLVVAECFLIFLGLCIGLAWLCGVRDEGPDAKN